MGAENILAGVDGVLVPGGFGMRGIEGKIEAIGYARRKKIPFFGICLGMQCAAIEFARTVLGLADANSTEFDTATHNPVIALMADQKSVTERGGTMRLGLCPCVLTPGSHAHEAYGRDEIGERHRHRFEFNNDYRQRFEDAGFVADRHQPGRSARRDRRADGPPVVPRRPVPPRVPVEADGRTPALPRVRRRVAASAGRRPRSESEAAMSREPRPGMSSATSPRANGSRSGSRTVGSPRSSPPPASSSERRPGSRRRSGTSRRTAAWGCPSRARMSRVDLVAALIVANARRGVARFCPTLITAPFAAMRHGVATIAAACEQDPKIDRMVLGIHLEGPAISERDGYRGAHPLSAVRDPDWDEFCRLQDAAKGRIILVTLAPERPGAIPFIEKAVRAGVTIALGHTAADAGDDRRRRLGRRAARDTPRQRDRLAAAPASQPDLEPGRRRPAVRLVHRRRPSRRSRDAPGPAPRQGPVALDPRQRRQPARGPRHRGRTASGTSTRRARSSWPGRRISPARTGTCRSRSTRFSRPTRALAGRRPGDGHAQPGTAARSRRAPDRGRPAGGSTSRSGSRTGCSSSCRRTSGLRRVRCAEVFDGRPNRRRSAQRTLRSA